MQDEQRVMVSADGMELLSWSFEFPKNATREDITVICDHYVPIFVVKETIGAAIINTRGMEKFPGEDTADRRRDDNLREIFGG